MRYENFLLPKLLTLPRKNNNGGWAISIQKMLTRCATCCLSRIICMWLAVRIIISLLDRLLFPSSFYVILFEINKMVFWISATQFPMVNMDRGSSPFVRDSQDFIIMMCSLPLVRARHLSPCYVCVDAEMEAPGKLTKMITRGHGSSAPSSNVFR